MRGASSLVLASAPRGRGRASSAPTTRSPPRRRAGSCPTSTARASVAEVVEGADAVVLVTEWPEFLALDWNAVAAAMAGDVVIDGRNALDAAAVRAAGLRLRGNRRRMSAADDAGGDPRRRRGDAAAAADLARRQAGRDARRPAVHRLHARVAAPPRRHRRRARVRLPRRRACARSSATARATASRCTTSRSPSRSAPPARCGTPPTCSSERFLVCNGDILTDIDLGAQLAQHERTGARATLALIAVEDPSAYGLVRCDADGAVARVRREAARGRAVGAQLVSAGAYVLERSVLDLIAAAGAPPRSSARSGRR